MYVALLTSSQVLRCCYSMTCAWRSKPLGEASREVYLLCGSLAAPCDLAQSALGCAEPDKGNGRAHPGASD